MTQRRVTVNDVARRAGVSIATVSRAINGSRRITAETLARVNEAVEELGFSPTPAARNLRQRRTRSVALIVPSITNPFFPELVSSVHDEVHRRGYSLLLLDAEETDAEAIRVIHARIADGILLVGSPSARGGVEVLRDSAVPVIAIDRAPAGLPTTLVQAEHARGAAEVVTHLAEQGHARIAYIAGPEGLEVSAERARGYAEALTDRGLEPDPALVVPGDFSEDSGYGAASRLADAGVDFSAVFAANDMMAIGAMTALTERGISVPGDVAVAGFDGIHLGRYVNPKLTTYVQPIGEMARSAVEILFATVGDADAPAPPPQADQPKVLRFAGHLVVRESSGGTSNAS